MTILSYATLSDGTLMDFEQDGNTLTVRAGHSLMPDERARVFTLTSADASTLGLHLAGFLANVSLADDAVQRTDRLVHTLEEFVDRGQRVQAAIDALTDRLAQSMHGAADAAQAFELFERMSSAELTRLLDAHRADERSSDAPETIAFCAGRQALIRHVLTLRQIRVLDERTMADALSVEIADGERPSIAIVLRPIFALQLAVLLQIAMRHPTLRDGDTAASRTARMVIEHARHYFSDAPGVLALLRENER